jgi:hypothetical protein
VSRTQVPPSGWVSWVPPRQRSAQAKQRNPELAAVVVIVPPGIGVCGLPRWRAPWTVIAGTGDRSLSLFS